MKTQLTGLSKLSDLNEDLWLILLKGPDILLQDWDTELPDHSHDSYKDSTVPSTSVLISWFNCSSVQFVVLAIVETKLSSCNCGMLSSDYC